MELEKRLAILKLLRITITGKLKETQSLLRRLSAVPVGANYVLVSFDDWNYLCKLVEEAVLLSDT